MRAITDILYFNLRICFIVLLFFFPKLSLGTEKYPAACKVTTTLNVRSGPGTSYSTVGVLYNNNKVVVKSVTQRGSYLWGNIRYNNREAYIAMQYVTYLEPVYVNDSPSTVQATQKKKLNHYLGKLWDIVSVILKIAMILLLIAFWKQLLQMLIFAGLSMGGGYLIFSWLFDNGELGSTIGLIFAILISVRMVIDSLGIRFASILTLIYKLISLPIYLTNKLQHFLSEPWRYFFKTSWVPDSAKEYLRPILHLLRVLLYIAITPLRLFNAIVYNIFVYALAELYSLFFEVLRPCSRDEGADGIGSWLINLPLRILKYPVCHGGLALIEGVVWTVIDIFIPAVTMYHGTDMTAGKAITSNRNRNAHIEMYSGWRHGTFTASSSSWGGIGVYFASSRRVAQRYACDPYRLDDNNPVMIVCRVSLGSIINYSLAPYYVYKNAGKYGNPSVLNSYGQDNGYTTGEWWNEDGGYWEYCMFDWQNLYNHPWRIRPIYLFNFRTGRVQHVAGGKRHWLFDAKIFKSFMRHLDSLSE